MKKLSAKIFVVSYVGTLITVVAVGIFAFRFTISAIQQQVMSQQLTLGKQVMNKIDRMLNERMLDIQQIASEEALEKYLTSFAEEAGAQPPVELGRRMRELAVATGPWDVLFIVDSQGRIVLDAGRRLLGDRIDAYPVKKIAFDAAMKGDVYHSDVVISKDTGWPTIIYAAPIRDENKNGRPIVSVVVGNFSWPAVLEILTEVPGNAILLNQKGQLLGNKEAMSRPELITEALQKGPVFPWLDPGRSGSMIVSGKETGFPEETVLSIINQPGHLAYRGGGWRLILETTSKLAFASATRTTLSLVAILALFIIASGWIGLIVINRFVVRPISRLTEAVQAVGQGISREKVRVDSDDEIGELAVSFNNMAEKVRGVHASLEAKVAERTTELGNSKMAALNMMQDAEEARIKAEQMVVALSQSEHLYRSVLETANDAFVAIDSHSIILEWNNQAEKTFGWRREECVGKQLTELVIPPRYVEAHKRGLKKFLTTGEGPVLNKRVELTAKRRDNSEFPIEITIWPLKWESSFRFIAFIRDITEKKKTEGQLIQSQKMETVGTLAGGIAHDLNNQLTPVKGYIDMILLGTPPDDPDYPLLQEANKSVERCAEVVHRLLNFSRSSGQKKEFLSMCTILEELKGMMKQFLPSTIQVEILCPKDIHPIEGSETEIQSVFLNLAANARDAMPQGGKLQFDARNINLKEGMDKAGHPHGDFVVVGVSDTGVGIAPEMLTRIFEPFFTTKKKGEGTGLGLAMVFKIVKDAGGWVDVSSQVGKGTTFHIFLPAKTNASISKAQKSVADIAAFGAKGETVLFADDEEMIRRMGKVILEKLGYKVVVCVDAEEAVDVYRAKKDSIDVLLVDMTMPKLTGAQMLKKIFEINPGARVIVASGYTSEGNYGDIRALGAAEFIQKPYTLVPLAKCLRTVLAT